MKDVAIIGAGPCGISAAIYLKRAKMDIVLLERSEPGGLLLNAKYVENYPGFWEGIGGPDLVSLFKKQLFRLKIDVLNRDIRDIKFESHGYSLISDENEIVSSSVIIASGTTPKDIGLRGQSELLGRKLFYEIKSIPPIQMEDTFVIIGSGDAAYDYALNLSDKVKRVDIINRNPRSKCLILLKERVKQRKNIFVHHDTLPYEIEENDDKIEIRCTKKNKKETFSSQYGLIACGREPNLNFVSNEMKKRLEFLGDGETNFPGLFIGGDVTHGKFRQTGIAVGDGIICAMKAQEFLEGEHKI